MRIRNGYTRDGECGGFVGLLGAAFIIGLKLTGVIAWPWLWVLAPLWISLLGVLVLSALLAVLRRPR